MSPNNPPSIVVLVERLKDGDPEAAADLFARYAQRLSRFAAQHLNHKLVGRVDGEDVVQSVFRTFFRHAAEGEFHIDSSTELWQLLVIITLQKTQQKWRFHTAGKRDANVEAGDCEALLAEITSREPGPEECAALEDEIQALVCGLPELHANVLERRLQGYSTEEIAQQFGCSARTIQRILNLFKQRLHQKSAS